MAAIRMRIANLKAEADAAAAAAGEENPGAQTQAHVQAIWKAIEIIAEQVEVSPLDELGL